MKTLLGIFFMSLLVVSCSKSGSSYVNNPGSTDYLHKRPVGASARELLSNDQYQSLRIEILYMPGFAPDAAAVEHTRDFLTGLVKKTAGITIITKEIPASANASMSVNDIIEIERTQRTAFTTGTEIAVSVVYTNGSNTDPETLGVAYRNTSLALFGRRIHDHSGAIGQVSRTKLEATVLEHELGHLLGLVDLGSPMQTPHKEVPHGNHCTVTSCLMYYTAETTSILGFLLTGNIPSLDANCRADLQANGGK